MKRLLMGVVAALALFCAAGASATAWITTAAKASNEMTSSYTNVIVTRCSALPQSLRTTYGATSQLEPNGTREWNVFVCALALTNGNTCFGVYHATGQNFGDFRLSSFPLKGCTPYELHRKPKSG